MANWLVYRSCKKYLPNSKLVAGKKLEVAKAFEFRLAKG
jgi:hypothetical protein